MYFLFKRNLLFNRSIKLRPVEEFININLYRPLAFLILLILLKFKNNIKPEFIVLFHTSLIFISSFLLLFKDINYVDSIIFFLINLKIVLDNLDGQYSRIKEMESEIGRYLDTLMDFFGNLALFLAIGIKYNALFFSIFCFFLFTIILSYDFNLEYLYRITNGEKFRPDIKDKPSFLLNLLKKIYQIFLGIQDNFIRYLEIKVFQIIYDLINKLKKMEYSLGFNIEKKLKEIFFAKYYLHITLNMGLSTQLFILSIFILFNKEIYFFYFIIFKFLLLILVFFIRIVFTFFYGLLLLEN